MSTRPELSAIVLCYQAGESILRVIEPLYEELRAEGMPFELVLVANYWPEKQDATLEVVERFARAHDGVKVVAEAKRGAMGWDMRAGFGAASGEYLIVIDGDAQNPPGDVLRMYREMRARGVAVMKGRRITRLDGRYRALLSFAYNLAFLLLFRAKGLWDINGKPKGLTREALERMRLRSNDWFIDAEIVLRARELKLTIGELPVVFTRSERESFIGPAAIAEFLANMVLYRLTGRPRG